MTITAKTTYTEAGLRLFQQIAARRLSPFYARFLQPLYLLVGIVLLAGGGYYGWTVLNGDYDFVAIALAAGGIYLGAQVFWMGVRFYDFFAKRAMKLIPAGGQENFYSFEPGQVVISNRMRSGGYAYSQFGAVCETKDYFFLYFSGRNGYILEKSGIENATADELRELLNQRLEKPVVQLEGQ